MGDLISELLDEMNESQCLRNGATFMNLLDATAQNGQIQACKQYLDEFVQTCAIDNSMYVDKNCYGHLINCYANYFGKSDMEANRQIFDECVDEWNGLKQNNRINIADYILMLKCIKNYAVNIEMFDKLNGQMDDIRNLLTYLFENDLFKLFDNHQVSDSHMQNMRTSFNLMLDILFTIKDIDKGIAYFNKAESMKIYETMKLFDAAKSCYCIDLHEMTRYPAMFAVRAYLNNMQTLYEQQEHGKWKRNKLEIITGVGMSSVDWQPVLKPMVEEFLQNLSPPISYHLPSWNQGCIVLDNESLQNYFESMKPH